MTRISRRTVLLAASGAATLNVTRSFAQTKETLTFAAALFADAGRGDLARAWIEKFNKSQDRYLIEPVAIPFGRLADTVFTQMGGGGGPDLVRFDQSDFFAAVPAGRLFPVDDLLDLSKFKFQAADKFVKVGGKRFGIVFETANFGLLYNPALLKSGAPPKDFEAFITAAKESTGDGKFGYAYRATMPERGGFWFDLTNYVYGFGGQWGGGGEPTLNSPEVVEAVTQYKRVYDLGVIPKGANAATYRRMFWEGKIAMNIDNGGAGGIFAAQAPDFKFNAAASPFPNKAQGIILTMLAFNANSKKKAGAAAFIEWMLQPKSQAELQLLLGASNVATLFPRDPEEIKKIPWVTAFDANTPNGQPMLVRSLENRTLDFQQVVCENVLRCLVGGETPKQVMADAQAQALSRILRR